VADISAKLDSKEITEFLGSLSGSVRDINSGKGKYVRAMYPVIFPDVIKHFDDEMGPDGKWDHWSFQYELFMMKIGKGDNNILQDTGRLRQSNILALSQGKRGEVRLLVNKAKTKDNFPYALHHDEGVDGSKSSHLGNSRPFMWLSDSGLELVAAATLDFMLRGKA